MKKLSFFKKIFRKKRRPIKRVYKKRRPVSVKKKPIKKIKKERPIGIITHYFPRVKAGVVKLRSSLKLGDRIHIKGHTTDFTQDVTSMQINHVPIKMAKRDQEIGLWIISRVRKKDIVYKFKRR